MRKQYIEVPLPIKCSKVSRLWRVLAGFFLLPFYMIAAWILRAPGIAVHVKICWLAVRMFLKMRIPFHTFYSLICFPMDSTRYFEFHEVLTSLAHVQFNRYLDVSSPRLLPLILMRKNKAAVAEMINPDSRDIQETEKLFNALRLTDRCSFTNSTIETAKLAPGTYDLITCISVLEHIPSDREAVNMMWSLLRPGGILILTLPCMAQPLEQYISSNDYGVLSPGADGYTFWQRYYDEERLHDAVFSITGFPAKAVVYGERSYGLFYKNANMKRLLHSLYPFWRESYMVATEYRYFKTIGELPGEGVVMLEFIKP